MVILLALVVAVLMVLVAAVVDSVLVIDTGGERTKEQNAWKTFPKDTKEQVRISQHPVEGPSVLLSLSGSKR